MSYDCFYENATGVSDDRIIHCEDQISSDLELESSKVYVVVNLVVNKRKIIRVINIERTGNGRLLRFSQLNEYLEEIKEDCAAYLTDLGVMAYEYRGKLTWNTANYVRKLRSSDYISEYRLKTASRLLMIPSQVQKNIKISRKSA